MRTYSLLTAAALALAGCATTPEQLAGGEIPVASQLVLIAQNARSGPTRSNDHSPLVDALAGIESCGGGRDTQEFDDMLGKLTDEAIQRQTGLDREQIEEAAQLLASGQFASDLKNLVGVAVFTVPALERSLWQTRDSLRADLGALRDGAGPGNLRRCASTLLERGGCGERASLVAVVDRLYRAPPVKVQRDTLSALLDNRSFRLALIAYARSNGVDLEDADLDFVQKQIDREDIDLGDLVNDGKLRLAEKYRLNEIACHAGKLHRPALVTSPGRPGRRA